MARPLCIISIAVLGAAATACGSSADLALDSVTADEAVELTAATLFATFNSTSVIPPAPESLPAGESAPTGWSQSFEAEVRCPGGGRVGLAATVIVRTDPLTDRGEAEYTLGQIHDECRVQTGGDHRFAISGGPRLEATVGARHDGAGRVEWVGQAMGRIDWAAASREGQCDFDVDFTAESDGPGRTMASVTGAVCGHPIEGDIPIR